MVDDGNAKLWAPEIQAPSPFKIRGSQTKPDNNF